MLVDYIVVVSILASCSDVITLTSKLLALQYLILLLIYRQKKSKDMKHSSSLSKEAKRRSGKSHIVSDDPKNMYIDREGNSVAHTDIPERMQVML